MPRFPQRRRAPIAFAALLPLIGSAQQVFQPQIGSSAGGAATALAASERAQTRGLGADLERRRGLRVPVLTAAGIQRRVLDAGTVLIEYRLGQPRSLVWAVTPTSIAMHSLPGRSQIEAAVRRAGPLLGSRRRSDSPPARRAAAELSQLLLAPVSAALAGRRVLLVLDRALEEVPFSLLPDPAEPERPLFVGHELVRAPSASILAALREGERTARREPGGIAALGDPVSGAGDRRLQRWRGDDWLGDPAGPDWVSRVGRLRYSAREADGIARLAARQGIPSLGAVGFDASRELVASRRLDPFAVVHFATHAVRDAEGRPALLLSRFDRRGRPRPGLLSSLDIAALDLRAALVVLAGCRTGVEEAGGGESRGEGPSGLSRAFFAAGADRVMGTLWDVGDEASAELSRRFYRGLLERELSPAAALRAAQLELLRDPRRRAPWHWAGFVLQGDWR